MRCTIVILTFSTSAHPRPCSMHALLLYTVLYCRDGCVQCVTDSAKGQARAVMVQLWSIVRVRSAAANCEECEEVLAIPSHGNTRDQLSVRRRSNRDRKATDMGARTLRIMPSAKLGIGELVGEFDTECGDGDGFTVEN
jgi:hypothetical protein